MRDVMIDIETLSTSRKAVVLSIGAVVFDPDTLRTGSQFYSTLRVQPQLDRGREITEDTLRFWISQPKEILQQAFPAIGKDPGLVLIDFNRFLTEETNGRPIVWGNGSLFDIGILENLFDDYSDATKLPWTFRDVMDLRTFQRFVGNGEKVTRSFSHHNALTDAIDQTAYILNCLRKKP